MIERFIISAKPAEERGTREVDRVHDKYEQAMESDIKAKPKSKRK